MLIAGDLGEHLVQQGSLGSFDALVEGSLIILSPHLNGVWARIGPVSTPESTWCTVQPVTFTP